LKSVFSVFETEKGISKKQKGVCKNPFSVFQALKDICEMEKSISKTSKGITNNIF